MFRLKRSPYLELCLIPVPLWRKLYSVCCWLVWRKSLEALSISLWIFHLLQYFRTHYIWSDHGCWVYVYCTQIKTRPKHKASMFFYYITQGKRGYPLIIYAPNFEEIWEGSCFGLVPYVTLLMPLKSLEPCMLGFESSYMHFLWNISLPLLCPPPPPPPPLHPFLPKGGGHIVFGTDPVCVTVGVKLLVRSVTWIPLRIFWWYFVEM